MTPRGQNHGFVSLFTAIMISLLLLVITISLISLEALQLRKSEDSEQSLRAYYTAEAGVEDAVSKILQMTPPYVDQNCVTKTPVYDATGSANWTCQQISFSGTPFGKLSGPPEEAAKTVDPGHVAPPYKSVLLEWNQSTTGTAAQYNVLGPLPDAATYQSNYLASAIELSIVEYPNGGFPASKVCTSYSGGSWQPAGCQVKLQNALILPGGGGAPGTVDYGSATFSTDSPFYGNCSPYPHSLPGVVGGGSSAYNCWAIITNMNPGRDYLFRIRSRYLSSAFKMTFCPSSSATGCATNFIKVPDGMATIDVTARAGQTYRRVISKLPLTNGAAGGLNFVMYSDDNVCKNFDVIDNAFPATPGC